MALLSVSLPSALVISDLMVFSNSVYPFVEWSFTHPNMQAQPAQAEKWTTSPRALPKSSTQIIKPPFQSSWLKIYGVYVVRSGPARNLPPHPSNDETLKSTVCTAFKCGPQKGVRQDCFGSVHKMSSGWHGIGCTEDQLLNASQQHSFLLAVFIMG